MIQLTINGKTRAFDGLNSKAATAVLEAWLKLDAVQCGYCQSGQIMSALDLFNNNANPTDKDTNTAAGKSGTAVIALAVTNALFNATGQHTLKLPLKLKAQIKQQL